MSGRWVQPGEELDVSSREEDWRDCYGAYLEPVQEADQAPKKARKRRQEPEQLPVPDTESDPAQVPEKDTDPAPAGEGVPE